MRATIKHRCSCKQRDVGLIACRNDKLSPSCSFSILPVPNSERRFWLVADELSGFRSRNPRPAESWMSNSSTKTTGMQAAEDAMPVFTHECKAAGVLPFCFCQGKTCILLGAELKKTGPGGKVHKTMCKCACPVALRKASS